MPGIGLDRAEPDRSIRRPPAQALDRAVESLGQIGHGVVTQLLDQGAVAVTVDQPGDDAFVVAHRGQTSGVLEAL